MPGRLVLFFAQIVMVLLATGFHVLAASRLMRRATSWPSGRRRLLRIVLAALIVALDLPLLHLFVVYKYYNPLFLDTLFHDIAPYFLALHANVLILGLILLTRDYLMNPVNRWWRRRRQERRRTERQVELPAPMAQERTPHAPMRSAQQPDHRVAEHPLEHPLADALADAGAYAAGDDVAAHEAPASRLVDMNGTAARPGRPRLHLPRRRFLQTSALAATGIVTSASTLSAMRSTGDYRLERIVMKVPDLPEALKGTTIAIISDIHSSVFMVREEMERYAREVNALKADMIFVLGDFVNSKLREVYPFAEAFTMLKAPYGVFGVTGNHDYYTGEIESVAREVGQAGIRLIRNENLSIEKNGEKLWLLGIDDGDIYDIRSYREQGKTEKGTIENMMKGVPEHAPKLFLCHKPYPFEEYSQLGISAMFSGHTHGGQVVIAQLDNINLSFASLASRYVAGLYRARSNPKAQLYVTRGVGTVGIPIRLNCPPELTHVVLV